MKKLPKGLHAWEVPLYGGAVFMTCDVKKFKQASEFFGSGAMVRQCAGRALWAAAGDEQAYVIGVFDKSIRTLVHECNHVTLFIGEHVGIDPYASSGEPLCYLLDSMVGRFLPHLKK